MMTALGLVFKGKTIYEGDDKDKAMNQDAVFITCAGCGTNNRIPKTRLKEHPKCGKGKEVNKLLGAVPREEIESRLKYIL